MGAKLELGILGPVEVRIDEAPAALGGPRQRAVLAILAIRPNQVVSVDRLIDDLWEEDPPDRAVHTVHVFVSRLRRALSSAGDRLITRPPGYVLELKADELDADRFERLYKTGRAALNAGRAEDAVALLGQAMTLWRGPPLADFTYEPFAQGAIARLDELRLNAHEELIEGQLAAGRHEQVVSELEFLIREHPFRERPRGQLMLALYRCGRQAQALEAFQEARRTLIEELAVEPGDALRELEQAILRQDPALQAPTAGAIAEATSAPAEVEIEPKTPSAGDEETEPAPVARKTATVLVTKLSAGGEADPELALRSIAAARHHVDEIVARHGGAFVSGLGGELAWVFGVPLTREDDVVRALRAADELRTDLKALAAADLHGLTVSIGIATGEVIAESPRDVWGEPLNRAIGLAQAAAAGEILLGDTTRRLAFTATLVEPALEGTTWRLLGLAERRLIATTIQSPMVGRDQELGHAHATFERTRQGAEAYLLTVLGEAGIGKSRLVQELGDRLAGEATVLTGRCLSYGDGVAFWPLREAVVEAAGEASRDGLRGLLNGADDSDVVADILAAALGLAPAVSVSEQMPWAMRRLLEGLARDRPVILVIDDAHWADTPLLDLIDYLVDWVRAPVVLVCLARPELLEVRPGWGGGHPRVSSIVLGPLDDAAALRLLDQRVGERQLSPGQRAHILVTAEGNPLFVEQLLQMSAEDPEWDRNPEIPGAIQSLLSARLDRLGPGERAFIERAAVIGREFWSTAVRELLPAEARPSADNHLRALVHRGLIHPDRSILAGEEQLRFHHILIRDVAYSGTPKSRRSELHERFADWLLTRPERYDEFIGYHLEQAFRYQLELGAPAAAAETLAARAGDHLANAGRSALRRGDAHAGVRLLGSARDLLEAAGRREPDVLLALGAGLSDSGNLREAGNVFTTALEQSRAVGDDNLAARASIDLSFNQVLLDPSIPVAEMLRVADEAVQTFERAGDDGGIARAWHHVAMVRWTQSRAAEMEDVLERALAHAERAGDWQMQSRILGYLARAVMTGPRPVTDAIDRCAAILRQAGDDVALIAVAETMLGMLEAMRGNFDDARSYSGGAKRRLEAVGLTVTVAALQMYSGWIELMAETPERAVPGVREAYELLERVGDRNRRAMTAAMLGRLLFFQGDLPEADRYLRISEECASSDDVGAQTVWRGTRARLFLTAGDELSANAFADTAVDAASPTDDILVHADALVDRAVVLSAIKREDAAMRDLQEATALFESKGITSSLAQLRRLSHRPAVAP